MKCGLCEKSELIEDKVEYFQFGVSLGKFNASVCPSCKETFFDGNASEQIEVKAKKMGLWGLSRKSKVGTSGSSLDVKIPKDIAEFLSIRKGAEIVIEPLGTNKIEITVI